MYFLVSLTAFLVACHRQGATESRDANKGTDEVTVYVSTDRVFSEPVLKAYERKTGVKVSAVYDTEEAKSAGLANRLLAEKNTNLVKPQDTQKSIYDLTDPKWKGQIAIADPRFGSTSFQVAALYAGLGDEEADEFFRKLMAHGVKIAHGNDSALCRARHKKNHKTESLPYPDQERGRQIEGMRISW